MTPRVAVVGGGIAGLATAFRLQRAGAEPVVLERAGTHGGVIAPPVAVGDLELEPGPDSLAARKPWGVALCRDLGLSLIPPGATGAFLWTDAGLVPYLRDAAFGIPGDVGDVLRWPGLSRRGRVRALADLVKRTRRDGVEETLGELFRRRLGDEATDRAIAPLLAGLHAGDIDRLSADATFPELLAWESSQGSLIRGAQAAIRTASGAAPGPLVPPARTGDAGAGRCPGRRARRRSPDRRRGRRRLGGRGGARGRRLGAGRRGRPRVRRPGIGDPARLRGAAGPRVDRLRLDRRRVPRLSVRYGERAPGRDRLRRPTGRRPDDRCDLRVPEVAGRAVRGPGRGPLLRGRRGRRGRARRRRRGDRGRLRVASRRGARSPRTDRVARPSMVGSDAAVRARPSPSRRGIRAGLPAGIFLVGNAFDGVGVSDLARAAEETAEQVLAHAGAPRPGRREEPA